MDREDETKKYIRENWFKDHKAVLTKHGDLEVLDWKKTRHMLLCSKICI